MGEVSNMLTGMKLYDGSDGCCTLHGGNIGEKMLIAATTGAVVLCSECKPTFLKGMEAMRTPQMEIPQLPDHYFADRIMDRMVLGR